MANEWCAIAGAAIRVAAVAREKRVLFFIVLFLP
jgi:hypothetical protein